MSDSAAVIDASVVVAGDAKDNHLWSLLATQPGSVLVTGDRPLHRRPPPKHAVLEPREFVSGRTDLWGSQG